MCNIKEIGYDRKRIINGRLRAVPAESRLNARLSPYQFARSLAGDGVLVNSACPGFVASDMGSPMGATKSLEDGASGIVWLATLPDGGPTGGFFRDGQPIAF